MEDASERPTLDDFAPKALFEFPDGSLLVITTRRDDDDPLRYGVHLVYYSGLNVEPDMSILLPPRTIDMLIPVLQEMANEARCIMGQNIVEYPPMPQTKKKKKKKAAAKTSKVLLANAPTRGADVGETEN